MGNSPDRNPHPPVAFSKRKRGQEFYRAILYTFIEKDALLFSVGLNLRVVCIGLQPEDPIPTRHDDMIILQYDIMMAYYSIHAFTTLVAICGAMLQMVEAALAVCQRGPHALKLSHHGRGVVDRKGAEQGEEKEEWGVLGWVGDQEEGRMRGGMCQDTISVPSSTLLSSVPAKWAAQIQGDLLEPQKNESSLSLRSPLPSPLPSGCRALH